MSIQEKTIGIDTAAYLSSVHKLASILAEEKRYKEADQLYQEIMPKLKDKIGPDHPFVADTLDNWAVFAEQAKGKIDAEELRASARLIRRKLASTLKTSLKPNGSCDLPDVTKDPTANQSS